MNRKNDSLDLPIKRLIENQDNWRFVRQITLDEWADIRDKPQRLEHNDHVHGGMIATDVDLLSNRFLDPDRKRRWESAFNDAYGISFTEISGKNLTPELSTVLNRRASVLHLFAWADQDDRRKELVASADAVIAAWKEKEALFEEGSESKNHFDKIL
jgi:hypothetical protein